MKVTILGCGTSTGVPVIGCPCSVCTSPNPKDKRTRTSVIITINGKNILIDTSTDLRQQAIANNVQRIDAVIYTHPHADHIHGIDELRSFNMLQKEKIPCYGSEFTINRIKEMFNYIFTTEEKESWKPELEIFKITSAFEVCDIKIQPVDVMHGQMSIFGYRIENFGYITDCSLVPDKSKEMLKGIEVLVLGALREKPHPTHFSISQAVELVQELKPKQTILTHLSHNIGFEETNKSLPDGIELAYDGMEIEI
ncbi:MAG: MBL fold metallo-hydrolase [Deltaproteobacteria bacterium]|nr:MBL fold metallo-hydrolase [Deltaproteobacteria bacterium]